jgi:anti-sigma factor RsiW
MSCERMESRLVSYMDGRATERDRATIESHLKECSACRARVKGFQGVWSMLNELPVHEPSAAFEARLRALLAAEPVRRSFWEGLMPAPRMAFAVAMLAIFSLWISSRQPTINGPAASSEAEFRMIQDLPVLENYDVLVSFDVLSQLPAQPAQAQEKN